MDKLDRILRTYVANADDTEDKLLGAAFVVVDKDGVTFQGSAGRIDTPVDAPKFGTDSFTWVASLTKLVTVTCLLQLVEKNAVSLDEDIRPLVPELGRMQILKGFDGEKPVLEDNVKPITLRNLLTHTVGLRYDIVDPDLMRWSRAVGRTTTNLSFTYDGWNTPFKFVPGQGWYYGSGIDWATKALEKVTGMSLGQYAAENVFRPLNMRDSTFRPLSLASQTAGRAIACCYRDSETSKLETGPSPVPIDAPVESGGAGLYTTASDYAKLLSALLAAGCHEGKTSGSLLKKETVDEMFRPQLNELQRQMLETRTGAFRDAYVPEFPPGTAVDHGLSGIINTVDVPGKRKKGSMMWMGMCNSHWWIDREAGIGACLVLNVQPQPDPVVVRLYNDLELAVYEELLPSVGRNGSTKSI